MFGTTIDELTFHHICMMERTWTDGVTKTFDTIKTMKEKGFILKDVKTQAAGEYHILVILCWTKKPEDAPERKIYGIPYNAVIDEGKAVITRPFDEPIFEEVSKTLTSSKVDTGD